MLFPFSLQPMCCLFTSVFSYFIAVVSLVSSPFECQEGFNPVDPTGSGNIGLSFVVMFDVEHSSTSSKRRLVGWPTDLDFLNLAGSCVQGKLILNKLKFIFQIQELEICKKSLFCHYCQLNLVYKCFFKHMPCVQSKLNPVFPALASAEVKKTALWLQYH